MNLQVFFVLFAFIFASKAFGNATAQGDVSVEIIYKESIDVTNIVIDKNGAQPSSAKIEGKPGSNLTVEWSESAKVTDASTGKEVTVPMQNGGAKNATIGKDSQLTFDVTPQKVQAKEDGNFKGNYNLNLTY